MIFKLLNQHKFEEIKKLVEKGSLDLMQTNEFGNTLLHEACTIDDEGNFELVKLFLNSGLDYDINAGGIDGFTPLQYAVSFRSNDIVKILLEKGALINKTSSNGNTPIWNAVSRYKDNDEIIKTLLENGADPHIPNNFDITLYKLLDMPKNKAIKPLFNKFKE